MPPCGRIRNFLFDVLDCFGHWCLFAGRGGVIDNQNSTDEEGDQSGR